MRQIGGEQQQAVLLRRKDTTGDSSIREGDRHHMAEIIFRCLKFKFTTGVFLLGSHIENSTELSVAMGVLLDRAPLPGTDNRPGLLDVNLQAVVGPEQ